MTNLAFLQQPRRVIEKRPHQVATVEFLLGNKRCFNLSGMGTGKTLPAVEAIQLLYGNTPCRRILVVAPLSVIRATWEEHLSEFAPEVPVVLMDESTKRRKQAAGLAGFEGVVIVNPDGVKSVFHELADWKPTLIVIDELAGYYRNRTTDRWKAIKALDALCQSAMWAFTGTPVTNSLMDSYAQILLVNPKAMPRNSRGQYIKYTDYRDMLHNQPYPNTWVPKKGAEEKVYGFMQPAIRFTREEVMKDVKEQIRMRKQIPLTPEQKKLYAELQAKGRATYGDAVIPAAEMQALTTKVVQIATGCVYDQKGNPVDIPSGPRLQAMFDLFEEVERTPLIVAVPFIHTAERLKKEIAGRGYAVDVIIGDVAMKKRADIVRRFQARQIDFLVCHPKTMAHGLTLTRSSTVLWFAPLYDLELYAQANARIERYGQEGQPLVVEFCSTPSESRIYAAIRNKEKLAGKFLDLFQEG